MKTTITAAALCLAIGFASGWLLKSSKATSTAHNDEASARSTSQSATVNHGKNQHKQRIARRTKTTATPKGFTAEIDLETQKTFEENDKKEVKLRRKSINRRFELQIVSIAQELRLNAAQEKSLRAFYDEYLKQIYTFDIKNFHSNINKLATALDDSGLNNHLQNILSDEQLEKLEALQKRKKNSAIDARTLKKLGKLQQTLDLSEEQRHEVYDAIREDVEKTFATQDRTDFLTHNMKAAMGGVTELSNDNGNITMTSVTHVNLDGSPAEQAEMKQLMKDNRNRGIDEKIRRLQNILNETQLEQYRESLESNDVFRLIYSDS